MSYEVSTDKSRLDIDLIHNFLSKESYWATNIPRDVVERSIENAICFGAYEGKEQVGFARVVTDYAVFAYVGDVFVRGRGVSKLISACASRVSRCPRRRRCKPDPYTRSPNDRDLHAVVL
ncbi:MAG TPA: hypothetical protein VGS96_15130 [Thermoanaerobaculia bacterium]|jgi:hypothetical protein|nr:hypothetical protein [Thermoanaerobaculia bacterium]